MAAVKADSGSMQGRCVAPVQAGIVKRVVQVDELVLLAGGDGLLELGLEGLVVLDDELVPDVACVLPVVVDEKLGLRYFYDHAVLGALLILK